MAFGDSQIGHQKGHRFGGHAGTPIGMDRQLTRIDPLLFASLLDQLLGQHRLFPMGYHPSHYITAEDIENHVEVVICPLGRTFQLRYVPCP